MKQSLTVVQGSVLNATFINLLQSKLERVLTIGNSRQINTIISQKIEGAAEENLTKQPGEKEFTSETIEAFVNSVSTKLAPYIEHFSNKCGR
jgi:hypothetical protein